MHGEARRSMGKFKLARRGPRKRGEGYKRVLKPFALTAPRSRTNRHYTGRECQFLTNTFAFVCVCVAFGDDADENCPEVCVYGVGFC